MDIDIMVRNILYDSRAYAYKWIFEYRGYVVVLEEAGDFKNKYNSYNIAYYKDEQVYSREGYQVIIEKCKDSLFEKASEVIKEIDEYRLIKKF